MFTIPFLTVPVNLATVPEQLGSLPEQVPSNLTSNVVVLSQEQLQLFLNGIDKTNQNLSFIANLLFLFVVLAGVWLIWLILYKCFNYFM